MANKFYITTAIDYVNGPPHIGHALEKIQADVLARYHRVKGDEVFFLTGTDEHGLKIFRAAQTAGQEVQRFVDETAQGYRNLKDVLNLSWDDFIRTSDQKRHWPGAQKLWQQIFEAGDLYKKKYQGLYCVGCESFKTERDLVDGKCPDHQKEPEKIEQENWFFRLSKYQKEIEAKIASDELKIIPESRKNEILSFIRSGLEDISFSRPKKDLSWGVPVPNDPDQIMYVWCDALSNYITAIGYGEENPKSPLRQSYSARSDSSETRREASEIRLRPELRPRGNPKFNKWWPADLHIIGKDILRFHAAIWPGMLLSAKLLLPKAIFVHGFVTVEGQKMSKTLGNVINPFDLVEKYGTDPVRYYFLREIASHEDGDFSVKKFEDRYTADLANGLGNLVARTVTLGEKINPVKFDFSADIDLEIKKVCNDFYREYEHALGEMKLHEALASVWSLISFADRYINEKKPWEIKGGEELRKVLANSGYLLGMILNLVEPFLPQTGEKIRKQVWFSDSSVNFKKGENLFPRL
ncbi:MAG: class I tRNA ligase family protein [Parcubacteria group bacterium]|nr:class I tRNA ligase family protein [Parcubacteria group bacterium]